MRYMYGRVCVSVRLGAYGNYATKGVTEVKPPELVTMEQAVVKEAVA